MQFLLGFFYGAIVTLVVMRLCRRARPYPPSITRPRLVIYRVELPDSPIIIEGEIMRIKLEPNQEADIKVQPLGRDSQPSEVEPGSVGYESSDSSQVVAAENVDDETLVTVQSTPEAIPGEIFDVTISADSDLGEGVKTLTAILEVEILHPGARSLDVSQVGEVRDRV